MMTLREYLFAKINDERNQQIKKWGEQHHSAGDWMLILQEEIGEAAQDILQDRPDDAETELIQCAAVLVAWLEDILGPQVFIDDEGTFCKHCGISLRNCECGKWTVHNLADGTSRLEQ